jgi:hypothetical protein
VQHLSITTGSGVQGGGAGRVVPARPVGRAS